MWWKMETKEEKKQLCIWAKVWKRGEASSSFDIKQVEQ